MLREGGTERPFTGALWDCHDDGVYRCAACGNERFDSTTKFESGSGWPSFTEPKLAEAVELRPDDSLGMSRTEVVCRRCGGHLGHVFDDGPREAEGCATASTPARSPWISADARGGRARQRAAGQSGGPVTVTEGRMFWLSRNMLAGS